MLIFQSNTGESADGREAAAKTVFLEAGSGNEAQHQKVARYGSMSEGFSGHNPAAAAADASRARYAPPAARLRQGPVPRPSGAPGADPRSLHLASLQQEPFLVNTPLPPDGPGSWYSASSAQRQPPASLDGESAAGPRARPWLTSGAAAAQSADSRGLRSLAAPAPSDASAWDDDRSGSDSPTDPASQPSAPPQAEPPLGFAPQHALRTRSHRPEVRPSQPPQRYTAMLERRTAAAGAAPSGAAAPAPRSSSPSRDDEAMASRLQRREAAAAERLNREAAVRVQAAMHDQAQEEQMQARLRELSQQEEQELYGGEQYGQGRRASAAMVAAAAQSRERLSSMRSAQDAARTARMHSAWQQMRARGGRASADGPAAAGPEQGSGMELRYNPHEDPFFDGGYPGEGWGVDPREAGRGGGSASAASRAAAAAVESHRAMRAATAAAAAAAAGGRPGRAEYEQRLGQHHMFGAFGGFGVDEYEAGFGGFEMERSVYGYGAAGAAGGRGGGPAHAGVARGLGGRRGGAHYAHLRETMVGMVRSGLPPQLLFSDRDFTADDYEMLLKLDEKVESRRGATQTVIDALPVQVMGVPAGEAAGLSSSAPPTLQDARPPPDGEAVQCSICLDDVVGGALVKTLPCLHRFHQGCIDKWLRQKSSCPICNRDCMSG
ncbi:MAG: hypothetical protein WDW38_008847 [Sanguina aurantia]